LKLAPQSHPNSGYGGVVNGSGENSRRLRA
jgi:hypothetical protein